MERAAVLIVCTVIQNDERMLSCVDANCDVSLRLLKKSACTRSENENKSSTQVTAKQKNK